MGVLAKTAPLDNWIDRLSPALKAAWHKTIIYRAAVHLHRERGFEPGHAIATALSWARSTLASGDIRNWPGKQNVNAGSLAEMSAGLAVWASMRAYAKSHKG